MKYYSKKEKLKFAKMLRDYDLDKSAGRMPGSGAFAHFKQDIHTKIPFSFELKNQETISFWKWWEQADSEKTPNRPAVLVFSGNYRPIMCAMLAETFLDVLKELQDYKNESKNK
ncbi:MAG: hypothetical protein UT61_C0062G0013 [Candidatus Woesebacteria bacterium GW2011_GWA1_39_8]|uniref:Uncharacterized protein n=1 Tax=Candidatus Woesebacteria bacterium GW2011_GWA1_39_8 TaxID=1618552 RepID=A0A0G0PJ08_9BACT|nr:MAG: hypothetical protein UT61_C0062G0013 [Candidatus Woesebacteria bacterium GW2011_GWA1_39_8]